MLQRHSAAHRCVALAGTKIVTPHTAALLAQYSFRHTACCLLVCGSALLERVSCSLTRGFTSVCGGARHAKFRLLLTQRIEARTTKKFIAKM